MGDVPVERAIPAVPNKAGVVDSLSSYRLLEALRSGDTAAITPLLAPYEASPPTKNTPRTNTPLHLAVRCAKYPVVEFVLRRLGPAYLNAQDSRGQTPLHLAAGHKRADVVSLLLSQPEIDDTLRDASGETAREVASGSEVVGLLTYSHAQLGETYLALLAAYIASPPAKVAVTPQTAPHEAPKSPIVDPSSTTTGAASVVSAASGHVSNLAAEKLYHFLLRPRAKGLDFSARDASTGTTILHEAVKRKDLGLIKLVIRRGGDVLVRDKRGKNAVDLAKDERIKSVLKAAATSEGRALKAATASGAGGADSLAPNLGKPPAMRGYLSKWTNMARGYRTRWFVLDNGQLSYYRSQEDEGKASRGSISMSVARVSVPGVDKLKFEVSSKLGKTFPSFFLKGTHPVEVMRWVDTLRQNIEFARDLSKTPSSHSIYAGSIISAHERLDKTAKDGNSPPESILPGDVSVIGDDDTFAGEGEGPPKQDEFELLANSTKAQLELSMGLLTEWHQPAASSSSSGDVPAALAKSLAGLKDMLDEYVDTVGLRERYFIRKYEREIDAKRLWEENMKEVAAQYAAVESELHKVGRDNSRRKKALQEVRANILSGSSPLVSPGVAMHDVELPGKELGEHDQLPSDGTNTPLPGPLQPSESGGLAASPSFSATRTRRQSVSFSPSTVSRLRARSTSRPLDPSELGQLVDDAIVGEDGEESSDDDDEFYEAIETGTIPLSSPTTTATPTIKVDPALEPLAKFHDSLDLEPYEGYKNLRRKLPIDSDNRPPVSLWAILKGSIGKDLTKISFPVFFNEPTSMLQRMAEDLEFPECLDAASTEPDATKRVAFVAAFAMSNYSSTIGRIAKPFNPMLSETFEYVDLEKKYRYISEQVSHHPPISACIAQAPSWEYFGEVDAKNKFMGKSFEIRPTGVAHVKLRLPKAWSPNSPPAKGPLAGKDLVEEHYSWTKVTTSVSNFLLGNPIIDHFGDMVVTNHQTGEKCTLTFKQRGWRGSGQEIKGKVVDKSGEEAWDIAGKWSSQLVARRAGKGDLTVDVALPAPEDEEYVLLWKNSVKPPGIPFNLTPYAITLNDTPPELKAWLPPTDCRRRPDQHAFEAGRFEEANNLKISLEDHQRETRKKRELGQLPPHVPRWFSRKREPDTGELYWEPARTANGGMLEYWEERNRVGKARKEGQDMEWKGVDHIFGDY